MPSELYDRLTQLDRSFLIYEDFSPQSVSDRQTFRSLWEIRLGLDIRFN